jgi:hypothetical protein
MCTFSTKHVLMGLGVQDHLVSTVVPRHDTDAFFDVSLDIGFIVRLLFFEEKGFTGQGHVDTNLEQPT